MNLSLNTNAFFLISDVEVLLVTTNEITSAKMLQTEVMLIWSSLLSFSERIHHAPLLCSCELFREVVTRYTFIDTMYVHFKPGYRNYYCYPIGDRNKLYDFVSYDYWFETFHLLNVKRLASEKSTKYCTGIFFRENEDTYVSKILAHE